MSPEEGTPSPGEAESSTSINENNVFSPAEYEAWKQKNILKNTAILEELMKGDQDQVQDQVSHEKEVKEGKGKAKAKVKGPGKGKKAAKDCERDKTNEYVPFPFNYLQI